MLENEEGNGFERKGEGRRRDEDIQVRQEPSRQLQIGSPSVPEILLKSALSMKAI